MVNLWYWILAILMLGILVMLHEFGHFIAARITGVTVVEFAVGFGPKLLSRVARSGIRYSVRALPFGGYCRFLGEGEEAAEGEEAELAGPPVKRFGQEKIWKRAVISFAGPLMNVLTAIVLLFLLYFAIGIPIGTEPVVGGFVPDLPAESAGFEIGDRLVRINGVEIETTEQASQIIAGAGDQDIVFDLDRDGEAIQITVRPQWTEEEDSARYMIGIQYQMGTRKITYGFFDSVRGAFATTGQMSRLIIDVLGDLILRQEGMDELAGPIGTVTLIKEQTQSGGLFDYAYLASVISVNLALFNLLPIPGLDGSRLLFLLIEKIRGKPLDPNKEGIITLIGFALLVGLMILALYQDIVRLIQ